MIVRRDQPPKEVGTESQVQQLGEFERRRFSSAGGLTQFGAYHETLMPGARSSHRHWHEQEDEFLYLLSGEAVLIENDGEQVMHPGDAACWPAGVPNGHCLVNRSQAPCSFLIVGTRPTHDVCHYPDDDRTLYTEGDSWRVVDGAGTVLRSGRT